MRPGGPGRGLRRLRGGAGAVVPEAEVATYYDRPVVKAPVWKPEVPWYFFAGGMAGASSVLVPAAELVGDAALARAARRAAAVGAAATPALLIADLGVPARFLNMLRVFRPTSPLNMGSWLLTGYVPAAVGAAVLGELGRLPGLRAVAQAAAAVGGVGMSTYTAVLVADTAVPVWREARRELPFVFAASAAASAGAAGMVLTGRPAPVARRLALLGLGMELAASSAMERRLGELAGPYHEGRAARFRRAARALSLGGAVLTGLSGGRGRAGGQPAAVVGGGLVLAGSLCERWAVFRAGFQSAERPADTVAPQRARLEAREQPVPGALGP